jgi:ubiquinone/menaquinone biosynthesis C-methylase UbiE
MTPFDYGRRSRDYAVHRHGPPREVYARLGRWIDFEGAEVLDVATGPGTVAFELARRGATVTGIDLSESQIEAARGRAVELDLDARTSFMVARAEATGVPAASFDVVTSGQSWHWFDGPAVVREVRRVLRPGGMLAIIAYSYLSAHSDVAGDSEALILEYNPTWTMAGWTGLFPRWVDDVVQGGMDFVEQFCWDYNEIYSHEDWRGRIRTCNGVGSGGLSAEQVEAFDAAHAAMLSERYPDPVPIRHRLWCVMARRGGG